MAEFTVLATSKSGKTLTASAQTPDEALQAMRQFILRECRNITAYRDGIAIDEVDLLKALEEAKT